MSIWFNKTIAISDIKDLGSNTMSEYLGMEWMEIGKDHLKLRMPVNERTKQPYGLLHGGASCALAETAGSVASALVIDGEKFACVGLEINANHLRNATTVLLPQVCQPLHLGKTTYA